MIVAVPRAQGVRGSLAGSRQMICRRKAGKSFQHLRNVDIRNPMIDMPPTAQRRSQAGNFQLFQMGTRGLWADIGRTGQFLVRERATIHQLA